MTVHVPLRCAYSQLVADPTLSKLVLLNTGNYPSFSNYLNKVDTFQSGDWTLGALQFDPNGVIPGRADFAMAFDGANLMVYGGKGASAGDGVFQDTYIYNGTTWQKQTLTVQPFGRYKAEATFLSGAGAVLFGGCNVNGLISETWVWSSSAWTQISVPNGVGPAARTGHAMAASTTQVLMFGGQGNNSQFNDLWSYTTAGGWVLQTPTVSPSIRSDAAFCYDSVNNVFILHSGRNEYNYLPETWLYSPVSKNWSQAVIPNGGVTPGGVTGAQMGFDTGSGKSILFGGISAVTNYPSNSTYAFDGAAKTWTLL